MTAPTKLTFGELREGMKVFLKFPRVEREIQKDVKESVQKILLSKAQNGGRPPVEVMADYLDAGPDTEERIKIIVGFSQGSLEKIKRIYKAIFPGEKWSKLKRDENIRRRIANFLVDPETEKDFIPLFIRGSFPFRVGGLSYYRINVTWSQLLIKICNQSTRTV